jgi:hypothetical protein
VFLQSRWTGLFRPTQYVRLPLSPSPFIEKIAIAINYAARQGIEDE